MSESIGKSGSVMVTQDGDVCRVAGTLNFETAGAALEQVRPMIEKASSLTIDLDGVSNSNSAGLALMIEWLAIGRSSGHDVSFARIPDGLVQIAGVCQVDGLI